MSARWESCKLWGRKLEAGSWTLDTRRWRPQEVVMTPFTSVTPHQLFALELGVPLSQWSPAPTVSQQPPSLQVSGQISNRISCSSAPVLASSSLPPGCPCYLTLPIY
jgi:hypothetical protein